jgi:ABC-type multidrug transport system fused ATPase/permease subunit
VLIAKKLKRSPGAIYARIEGIRLIQVFGQTAREEKRLESASEKVRRSIWTANNLSAAVGSGLEIGHAALFIGILLGAYNSEISLPVLGTFLVYFTERNPFFARLSTRPLRLLQTAPPYVKLNGFSTAKESLLHLRGLSLSMD